MRTAEQHGLRVVDTQLSTAAVMEAHMMTEDLQPRTQTPAIVRVSNGRLTIAGGGRSQDPVWGKQIARGIWR